MAVARMRDNGIVTEELGFEGAKAELLRLTRKSCYAAMATSGLGGAPQVAPLRYIATDDFEIVMGTIRTSRKYANLTKNPQVALVIWEYEMSIQIEGRFEEPATADEEERLRALFTTELPHEAWLRTQRANHLFFRVVPTWARCSDFSDQPPRVLTLDFEAETESRETFPIVPAGWPDHEPG